MMRAKAPDAFDATFHGPEGRYGLHFEPVDEWDGIIRVEISDHSMIWNVDLVEIENRVVRVCGMTSGTYELWNDVFWFELSCDPNPVSIRYWGDRVVWREDAAVAN